MKMCGKNMGNYKRKVTCSDYFTNFKAKFEWACYLNIKILRLINNIIFKTSSRSFYKNERAKTWQKTQEIMNTNTDKVLILKIFKQIL